MTALPDTLRETITAALGDVDTVLSQPAKYDLDMSSWVRKTSSGKCVVCMAGALITQRLVNMDLRQDRVKIEEFSDNIKPKLVAINSFRLGDFDRALAQFYVPQRVWDTKPEEAEVSMETLFDAVEKLRGLHPLFASFGPVKSLLGTVDRAKLEAFLKQPGVVAFRAKLRELNL